MPCTRQAAVLQGASPKCWFEISKQAMKQTVMLGAGMKAERASIHQLLQVLSAFLHDLVLLRRYLWGIYLRRMLPSKNHRRELGSSPTKLTFCILLLFGGLLRGGLFVCLFYVVFVIGLGFFLVEPPSEGCSCYNCLGVSIVAPCAS